jgi:cysteinyl-tRNA synthetase
MQSLITNPKKFDINQEISTFRYIFEGSKQDLSLSKEDQDKINQLIKLRLKARENGDYQAADKIRDELNKMHVSIKDKNGKTEWEIL